MSDRVCIASKGSQNVPLSPQDMVSWYSSSPHLKCRFCRLLRLTPVQRHSGFRLLRCSRQPLPCSLPLCSLFPIQAATFSTHGTTWQITAWHLTRAFPMPRALATRPPARRLAQTTAPSPGRPRCCPLSRTAAALRSCRTRFSRTVRFRFTEQCIF